MTIWGINALNHGNSLAVFAGAGYELSMFEQGKNDELSRNTIFRAFNYGGPSEVYWYERPLLKKLRQFRAGQYSTAFDLSVMPKQYLSKINVDYAKIKYTPHHASHAAAGYYTSPFNHCAIVVIDAIGEFECATIWEGKHNEIKKVWSRTYPNSLGLFYSAFTKLIGYKPLEEEHLLQRDSELGDPRKYLFQVRKYFNGVLSLNTNFHRGVHGWPEIMTAQDRYDIAAAVQQVFEEQVDMIMLIARRLTGSDCLVYMGGCAMNSKYNKQLPEQWNYIWSLPDPGDASSAIGAVLYHKKNRIDYKFGVAKHIDIIV
jgi:carbamoyltransferase